MNKLFTIISALIHRTATIERVEKIFVLRTPGDVTDVAHN